MAETETNSCLIPGCDEASYRRGVCSKHYMQFCRERDAQENPDAFEASAIASGLLNPSRQGQKQAAQSNPYRRLSQAITDGTLDDLRAELAADEAINTARELSADEKPRGHQQRGLQTPNENH